MAEVESSICNEKLWCCSRIHLPTFTCCVPQSHESHVIHGRHKIVDKPLNASISRHPLTTTDINQSILLPSKCSSGLIGAWGMMIIRLAPSASTIEPRCLFRRIRFDGVLRPLLGGHLL